jgi:hypothetical protein
MAVSELFNFSEHELQEGALLFMAAVYTVRIAWLLRFPAARERQAATGTPGTSASRGIIYSWAIIAMPWAMESSRKRWQTYLQFVVFHLGVTAAIALSFIIPCAPGLLKPHAGWVAALQALLWGAFAVGGLRFVRRIADRYLRAISSPDDFFSLALVTAWLALAALAAADRTDGAGWPLLAYFWLTALLLVYVPFSKISHYLYYPFTRFYLGRSMGHRGVFPLARSVKPARARARIPVGAPVTVRGAPR